MPKASWSTNTPRSGGGRQSSAFSSTRLTSATSPARAPSASGLPLRGRDREMAAVREDLEAVRGGRGAHVVVEGAPGVGKSRLLAELDETARRFGFDVVSVRADELDQYAAGAALQPADDAHRAAAATDDQRLWLLDGIADALEARAQRAPVAVVVDDAQWADPATLFVLRTLPGRLAASRILWVLAVRSEAERPTVARVREDLERLGARRLTLGPLPQQELLHIAADALGTAAERTDTGLVEDAYRSDDPAVVVSAMVVQSQTFFYRGRLARALELAEAAAGHTGTESAGFYLRPRGFRRCGWPWC
ncbi:ATP-binding protein [Stenotrophomonas sp. NPDC087984]